MASVRFRLNNPTTPEKPVSILVRFYSKKTGRIDLATGEVCAPLQWEGQRVGSKNKSYSKINKHLSQIESDLLDLWRDSREATAEELRAMVKMLVGGNKQPYQSQAVVPALQKFIQQYSREKESGTVKRYRGLLKKIEAFNANLTFEQLDFNFYDEFKKFLYSNPNPVYCDYAVSFNPSDNSLTLRRKDETEFSNVGLFDDTVFKYLINLKTVCKWAEKRGYEIHSSHKDWEIIKRDYQPISLTLDELRKLESIELKEKHLDIARDFLSLECRTGQRISDLRRFNKTDIVGNVWTFTQKKGNRLNANQISLPLVGYCAPALVILQKYNYELPRISEQKLNKHIKQVCKEAGICSQLYIERYSGNKKVRIPGEKWEFLSTHTGRKTFITIALQFMKPHVVMQITGIKSFKTLKHYAGESELSTIEAGLKAIEDNISVMRKAN